jgi:anti-anti-sigma regulatory factor
MSKPTLGVLEDCQKDLSERADTLFVMVFRDVTAVDLSALGLLTRIQKCLREKGALRTCSPKPEIRKFLLEKAAIRESEHTNNLAEALESLKIAQGKIKPGRVSE